MDRMGAGMVREAGRGVERGRVGGKGWGAGWRGIGRGRRWTEWRGVKRMGRVGGVQGRWRGVDRGAGGGAGVASVEGGAGTVARGWREAW